MRKSKYSHLIEKVKSNLAVVFRPSDLQKIISKTVDEEVLSQHENGNDINSTMLYRNLVNLISTRKKNYEIELHNLRISKIIFSFKAEIEPIYIANAFVQGHGQYLGNLTAMYLNGLTDQRPKSYYICSESLTATTDVFEYSVDKIKMSFMKSHRITQRYFEYEDNQYFFIEKQQMNALGIVFYEINDEEYGIIKIPISNIERTFLDSVVSPQYSGGIIQVIESFKNAKLDIHYLKKIYDELSPKYPYWQKIGFILNLGSNKKNSIEWKNNFKNEKMEAFFLDKEYRSTWKYSEEWKIYYPQGIRNE